MEFAGSIKDDTRSETEKIINIYDQEAEINSIFREAFQSNGVQDSLKQLAKHSKTRKFNNTVKI